MDNNNPSTPVNPVPPATPQATQPVQPASVTPPPAPAPLTGGNNNKMFIWLFLVLVIILVIGGAVLWYLGNTKPQDSSTTGTQSSPKHSPASQNVDSLERDLNSTALDDLDKEFSTVDTDLKEL